MASKAGGFAALVSVIYVGFYPDHTAWQPTLWVLAAASMTLGNLTALRQTNIVRMLAYSSIAQGGFILVPLAVAGESASAATSAREAVIVYLLIYGAMNLGAFAVVMALARRTRSGEISSYAGLMQYSPGLALVMSAFMFSLAGVPPLAGWFAKFVMFRAVIDAATPAAVTLGVIAAVNSVIAFFYYVGVVRQMWLQPAPEGTEQRPVAPAAWQRLAITRDRVVVGSSRRSSPHRPLALSLWLTPTPRRPPPAHRGGPPRFEDEDLWCWGTAILPIGRWWVTPSPVGAMGSFVALGHRDIPIGLPTDAATATGRGERSDRLGAERGGDRRDGPWFSRFMDAALYTRDDGFFSAPAAARPGRCRFVTQP